MSSVILTECDIDFTAGRGIDTKFKPHIKSLGYAMLPPKKVDRDLVLNHEFDFWQKLAVICDDNACMRYGEVKQLGAFDSLNSLWLENVHITAARWCH